MANDLNKWQGIGRLGKNPEIRYSSSGKAIASFSVACGSSWKDKQTGEKKEATEWVNCTAFDRLAEIVGEYLHKGSRVYAEGRIKTDKYEKDGQTHYSTKVIVEVMQMLDGKSCDEERHDKKVEAQPAKAAGFDDFDKDIPF